MYDILQYISLTLTMGIKYAVNEEFFDKWHPEMAYVLGYFYADGNLINAPYVRAKYVSVTSTDKHIILNIKKWLNAKHPITLNKPTSINGKSRYLLRIGSQKLYDSLVNRGLHPNKSLTVKFPEIPKIFLKDFVRGYFDGDGCVFLETSRGKRQKMIIKRLSIIFTCGSKVFLEKLAGVLKENINLKNTKVYPSHRSFQLRYPTSDTIQLFKLFYRNTRNDLYFERKLKIFLRYFKLNPNRVDKDVKNILRCLL